MPKLSIIIPVYNKALYLRVLFDEIRTQSFCDFECLLIDDGSSDGSSEICDQVAEMDSRFRVRHIPNSGVSNARNLGLKLAQGEYITFIDSDDEIYSEYLENLCTCMEQSNADLVISGYEKFWEDNRNPIDFQLPYSKGLHTMTELLPDFCRVQKETGIYGCCTAKIFSRSLVSDVKFDESLKLGEDFDFYLKLYAKIKTVYVDFASYYFYRQAAENSSAIRSDYDCDYLSQLYIYLRFRSFLQSAAAYTGENKKILDEMLQNYVYFSAFYCKENQMKTMFSLLSNLMRAEQIGDHYENRKIRFVLSSLRKQRYTVLRTYLVCYRALRKLMNRRV